MLVEKFISPRDREVVEKIMEATSGYYLLDKQAIIDEDSNRDIINIRHIICYLISVNTSIKKDGIAYLINKKSRCAISNSIETIEVQKRIYKQTLDDLKGIVKLVNSFEKKYEWLVVIDN